MNKKVPTTLYLAQHEVITPDILLWRKVILQAFIDLTKDTAKINTKAQRQKAELSKMSAKNWFLDPYGTTATDFLEVCTNAMLNYHEIRKRAQMAVDRNETFSYLTLDNPGEFEEFIDEDS